VKNLKHNQCLQIASKSELTTGHCIGDGRQKWLWNKIDDMR